MEIVLLIFILISHFHVTISSDFPVLIESCLAKLVSSDAKTGAASANVIRECFLDYGANSSDWDHPWIVSLYRGMFEAVICEEKRDCPTKKRVRREYRQLSDDERREYHTAIVKLYNDTDVADVPDERSWQRLRVLELLFVQFKSKYYRTHLFTNVVLGEDVAAECRICDKVSASIAHLPDWIKESIAKDTIILIYFYFGLLVSSLLVVVFHLLLDYLFTTFRPTNSSVLRSNMNSN